MKDKNSVTPGYSSQAPGYGSQAPGYGSQVPNYRAPTPGHTYPGGGGFPIINHDGLWGHSAEHTNPTKGKNKPKNTGK